ncbi:DUF5054 domain-containing protein [uncultured Boseongicola sp.]|jgi:hypothetical protein|uniref:DUF5054 domain-containing protein n=1 Tax=uncultured Boseongicola sp. TaxID=1648499 RepID=UPI0026292ADB|nr:DUF5054 domain-containing protein [uncultured Boseongicola sp.]
MSSKRIHLIFKTHLDIGFTDYASKVSRQYHDHFIPMALRTAEHLWAENPDAPKFIWTTGAWLIHQHLEQGSSEDRRRLEAAIEKGLIAWHALPYTTHTELLSVELFEAGLGYARDLDQKFGRSTTAAKMTDVPGHTIGSVPLLARAGVRFLHIGVNSASTPPDVPPVFRWRTREGDEILVMYQNEYGSTYFPEAMDDGIGFAHTMDNMGPQSIAQVVDEHRLMALDNPGATIVASTLTDYGDLLWAKRGKFPVVTDEIADSWIHGVGTAPAKVSRYMGLRRLYGQWAAAGLTDEQEKMGRRLCMVAEHTWGVDIKTFLRDESAWDRSDFQAARQSDPRVALTEHSWHEQDHLIEAAMAGLPPEDLAEATKAASPPIVSLAEIVVVRQGMASQEDGELDFDMTSGGLCGVRFPNGRELIAEGGLMGALSYESYDAQDYADYKDSYLTMRAHWGEQDHGKPGLENARTSQSATFQPEWLGVGVDQMGQAISKYRFDGVAARELGAPSECEVRLRFVDRQTLEIMACFFDKPANRMPEASFLSFAPAVDPRSWRFQKLGYKVDPTAVVQNGSRQLHAVESIECKDLQGERVVITPLDSPLVGPAEAPFLLFHRDEISMKDGIRFCLHNNKWGTNFPMWCEGDFLFRFHVSVE